MVVHISCPWEKLVLHCDAVPAPLPASTPSPSPGARHWQELPCLHNPADRGQVQAQSNFQGLSRCLCSFLLTLSHGFSILVCCSNLCNSALIPTEIFFSPPLFQWTAVLWVSQWPAGIIPACWVRLRDQTCSSSLLSACPFADAGASWSLLPPVLVTSISLPSQVSTLSGSSPLWWSLCSLHIWLLKLLLTHFSCWYHMGWEHHHSPSITGDLGTFVSPRGHFSCEILHRDNSERVIYTANLPQVSWQAWWSIHPGFLHIFVIVKALPQRSFLFAHGWTALGTC